MKRGFKLFGIIAISVLVVLGITSCPNNHDFERVDMIIINNSTVHTITALLHGKMVAGKFHVDTEHEMQNPVSDLIRIVVYPFGRHSEYS